MAYRYVKAITRQVPTQARRWFDLQSRVKKMIPNVLIVVGAIAVLSVGYPMVSYQFTNRKWEQRKIVSPLNTDQTSNLKHISNQTKTLGVTDTTNLAQAQTDKQPQATPVVLDSLDYTKAENWFPVPKSTPSLLNRFARVTTYNLSIPKLNIKDMVVEIGGDDLDKHLIHYAGTALPGQYGNPVIFGHSVLPVFYNPKSYISVFSKLPTLDEGDEIFVNYDGIEYRYVVESYHEVQPKQVEVLEQRYDRQTITLITCVPPGTYSRRGVIMGVLEK